MASLIHLKDQLHEFPCHFVWDLEQKSIKQFKSLMKSINDFIDECPEMKIEALLFKSYLFFSDFKGNGEKNKSESIKCLKEVKKILNENVKEGCLRDGYSSIVIALESWIDSLNKNKLVDNIERLRELKLKYKVGSKDGNMFQGSILATRGFALSRVGMTRYSESIEQLEKAVTMCPGTTNWFFLLGKIIWRKAKASNRRNEFRGEFMVKAETILKEILQLEKHSYAMVLMAEMKRRKGESEEAVKLLEDVVQIDKSQKILGEVGQVYRRMEKYQKALEYLEIAKKKEPCTSFIFHQLYTVYRNMKQMPPEDYLQMAIVANPSNMGAQCDRAKEFIAENDYDQAIEYYDNLYVNNRNDPEILIEILYSYAMSLEKIKMFENMVDKFQVLIDTALAKCKLNDAQPFTFFEEINWMVEMAAKRIRKYYIRQGNNEEPLLKLAELERKLGNRQDAIEYNQKLLDLQPPIDTNRRFTVLADKASMKIDNGSLDGVDVIIKEMEGLIVHYPNSDIQKIQSCLAVEKGKVALREGSDIEALHLFRDAVKLGNFTGAELLLGELQKMNKNKDFYIYCAEIDIFLDKFQGVKKETLRQDLHKVLRADPLNKLGTVLNNLRKKQFDMERSILLNNGQPNRDIATVIHECRIILDQTMVTFRNHHWKCKLRVPCKYFNVYNCPSLNIESEVRNKLTKGYRCTRFDQKFPDLFRFLVSIQPASNPQENNWMFALLTMDNASKHDEGLSDNLPVEVYSDKDGKMVKQEFSTLEVAREACAKIRSILEKFFKYL